MLANRVDVHAAQDRFVGMVSEIQARANATFRHLNPEAREEAAAETLALCWINHLRCIAQGKEIAASALAHYAMLGVKSGRGRPEAARPTSSPPGQLWKDACRSRASTPYPSRRMDRQKPPAGGTTATSSWTSERSNARSNVVG